MSRFQTTIIKREGRWLWSVQDGWKPYRSRSGSNLTRPGAEDSARRAVWKLTAVWLRGLPRFRSETPTSDRGAT